MKADERFAHLAHYSLLDALRDRRSRRFGVGMAMDKGPLAYNSQQPPLALSEDEEAALAFAACGVTGYALADLSYAPGEGGSIIAGTLGRTAASGDAIHTVSVFVTREDATYLLKRPQDFPPTEIPQLVELARRGELKELYRRARVRLADSRVQPPQHPMFNLDVNRWSLYDPASTYFLPVAELTLLYINGVLEIFGESTGAFVVDERAGFRPAGVGRFARSRGGHLYDDPRDERGLTLQQLESLVTEFVTIEQGMVLQNLGLMTQALGLGGFPHWAAHPFGWLEALGFRMQRMPASRYLGMGRLLGSLARLLGKDTEVPCAVGLEHDGTTLLAPYCPPYYPSMEAAVQAVVELKFGPRGVFRQAVDHSAWSDPSSVAQAAQPPSQAAIDATVAFCDYVYRRYGRFPAYPPPFRTVLGFQAGHVDTDYYDRFYNADALSETQRQHMDRWHSTDTDAGSDSNEV
ncbi:MAG: hypothetical protein AAF657_21805 [Acidobacteriota bacterium]